MKLRIALLTAVVLATGVAVTSVLTILRLRAQMAGMLATRAQSEAQQVERLVSGRPGTRDPSRTKRILQGFHDTGIAGAIVMAQSGQVVATIGTDREPSLARLAHAADDSYSPQSQMDNWSATAAVPLFDSLGTEDGAVAVNVRDERAGEVIRGAEIASLQAGVVAVVVGLMLTYALVSVLTGPLRELRKAIRRVTGGNYEERLRTGFPPEIQNIADAFNEMTAAVTTRVHDLEMLNILGERLTQTERLSDVGKLTNDTFQSLTGANARLWVFNPRSDRLESVPAEGVGGRIAARPDCLVSVAALESRIIMFGDGHEVPSVVDMCHDLNGPDAGAAIPLTLSAGKAGIILFGAPPNRKMDHEWLSLATAIANIVAPVVSAIIRTEAQAKSARLLQKVLAPPPPRTVTGIEVASWYQPAEEVARMGGDYYDFILSDNEFCVAIGDVSGKGLPAAEYTVMVKYALRSYYLEYRNPAKTIALTNKALAAQMRPEEFITLFLAVIDLKAKRIRYASAGHPPPLLFRADGQYIELGADGVAAGLFPDADYEERELSLYSGDTLILFTDGLSEARSGTTLYEEGQLLAVMRRCLGLRVSEILQCLSADARAFSGGRFKDDVAVVAMKFG